MVDAATLTPTTASPSMTGADAYRTEAYNATNETSSLQTSAPSLLNQLKQNLVGIFAKDNPIINERNKALADYIPAAAQSRAAILPSSMPTIEGRPLTLSPTQQDALTQATLAAKFAPLAGYNEILKGMYGNISDLVGNAGDIYATTIGASQNRSANLIDLYKTAVAEENARRSSANEGIDLAAILEFIRGQQGLNAPTENIDDIFAIEEPASSQLNQSQLNRIMPGLSIGNQSGLDKNILEGITFG